MKIGDKLPMPEGITPELVQAVMERRRMTRVVQNGGGGRNQATAALRKTLRETEEYNERMRSPIEQAKNFLRRKGYLPVATLDKVHQVGVLRFKTDKALFDFADERGWARSD